MKTFLIAALVFCLSFQIVDAGTKKTVPDKQEDWIEDQQDQTDIFAIPLDDSEAEEKEEEKELESIEKKRGSKDDSPQSLPDRDDPQNLTPESR